MEGLCELESQAITEFAGLPHELRIRSPDPSLQGLRLDRDAVVPLALQLLPQPLAAANRRLDERDLRTLGRGPRRHSFTPTHWYQATSALKLMIDRLACADGGNADPTTTHGKKAEEAKTLELEGWNYPKHLKGRAYGVVVHGDVAGIEGLRRDLFDWLDWMGLVVPWCAKWPSCDRDAASPRIRAWRRHGRSSRPTRSSPRSWRIHPVGTGCSALPFPSRHAQPQGPGRRSSGAHRPGPLTPRPRQALRRRTVSTRPHAQGAGLAG